jgi:PKD repeat protein
MLAPDQMMTKSRSEVKIMTKTRTILCGLLFFVHSFHPPAQAPLEIVTASLPGGVAGASYAGSLEARGGVPPYSWRAAGGNVPLADFVKPEGRLNGVPSVPGEYLFDVEVRDSTNATARRQLKLAVDHPRTSFVATASASLPSGQLWFKDFIVRSGVRVQLDDKLTQVRVTNRLLIEPEASLEGNCTPLVIDHLSQTVPLEIYGRIDTTCSRLPTAPPALIVRSIGSMIVGGDASDPEAVLTSGGQLYLTDAFYQPRPATETATVFSSGGLKLSPVCAIRSDQLRARTPVTIRFEVISQDPDGGLLRPEIDFGDGTKTTDVAALEHRYTRAGTYQVRYRVTDDEGESSEASLTLNLTRQAQPAAWVAVDPFVADSLIKPFGSAFRFASAQMDGASVLWDFGDGQTSSESAPMYAYDSPGAEAVRLSVKDRAGTTAEAQMAVAMPLQGGTVALSDPPAAPLPPPPLPPALGPLSGHSDADSDESESALAASHPGQCDECQICANPALTASPGFVILGNTALTTSPVANYIIVGFQSATLVIGSAFAFTGINGATGGPGQNGGDGGAFLAATITGEIIMCGGTFTMGDGGDGGPQISGGCPAIAQGGRGGDAGQMLLYAPKGTIAFCGPMTVNGGTGGTGGSATANGAPAAGNCQDGCDAFAFGGRGGHSLVGITYIAENRCFDQNFMILMNGGGAGGTGGNATANGGNGANCTLCSAKAGDGGWGRAQAGRGGMASWFFVTKADKAQQDIPLLAGHIAAAGTGGMIGGTGGNATGTGGTGMDGPQAPATCCLVRGGHPGTDGGRGGDATALAGQGGLGLGGNGLPGTSAGSGGNGGKGSDGCGPGAGGGRGFGTGRPNPIPHGFPGAPGPQCPNC